MQYLLFIPVRCGCCITEFFLHAIYHSNRFPPIPNSWISLRYVQQFLLTVLQSARVKAVISGLRKRHATLTGVNQKQTEVEIKLPAHLNFALHYFAVLFFISNNIIVIIIIVAVIISISYRIIVISLIVESGLCFLMLKFYWVWTWKQCSRILYFNVAKWGLPMG